MIEGELIKIPRLQFSFLRIVRFIGPRRYVVDYPFANEKQPVFQPLIYFRRRGEGIPEIGRQLIHLPKYFFNYANGGGLRVRVFASKFGYLGNPSSLGKLYTLRYQPKLTAITGAEDYTYSNYFIARNNFGSFDNQVMMRDGGLKLRTDRFDGLQGRSDNWIASMNLNTTLPQLTPIKIPLRVFVDAGTYAEAWHKDFEHPRFLYVAGLQLSLLSEVVNIYAPVLCSGFFRDQLKTVPEENKFFNRISFSIDVQRINFRKSFCRKKIW